VFTGKESESNWEARDSAVKQMRSILNSDTLEEYREDIVRGMHEAIPKLIQSVSFLFALSYTHTHKSSNLDKSC
jgi:hypothetical protein